MEKRFGSCFAASIAEGEEREGGAGCAGVNSILTEGFPWNTPSAQP